MIKKKISPDVIESQHSQSIRLTHTLGTQNVSRGYSRFVYLMYLFITKPFKTTSVFKVIRVIENISRYVENNPEQKYAL